jgi:ankyrin repeat protein
VATLLLSNNAYVDYPDVGGQTPLHLTAKNGLSQLSWIFGIRSRAPCEQRARPLKSCQQKQAIATQPDSPIQYSLSSLVSPH